MIYYGNVVRFKSEKNKLYVVKEAKYDGSHLDSIVLIPFDHSNTSTHISRKNPLVKREYVDELCGMGECDHYGGYCPEHEVPSPTYNIYEIEYVADCVTDFINKRFKRMMFE